MRLFFSGHFFTIVFMLQLAYNADKFGSRIDVPERCVNLTA